MPQQHSSGIAAVARLQRIADALAANAMPEPADAQWLAASLGRYLAAAGGLAMDGALGLVPSPGEVSWWRARQQAERDRLLRLVGAQWPGSSINARPVMLQQRLQRYAATAWPRDRVTRQPSAHNRLIFAVFVADPGPPTSVRRLSDILQPG